VKQHTPLHTLHLHLRLLALPLAALGATIALAASDADVVFQTTIDNGHRLEMYRDGVVACFNRNDRVYQDSACTSEARAYTGTARETYLAASKAEDQGNRNKALTLYRLVVERHGNSQEALMASQRLGRIRDVEAVERSNSDALHQSQRNQYDQCIRQQMACFNRCNHNAQCSTGCPSC
jgi:hypothetical protein